MSDNAAPTPRRIPWGVLALSFLILALAGWGLALALAPKPPAQIELVRGGYSFPQSKLGFVKQTLGSAPTYLPRITNVQIVDLDRDGLNDVIACDAQRQRVFWYRQSEVGVWDEVALGPGPLAAPGHATVVDLDQDGDSDILVSLLGDVWPTDYRVGAVVWLEQVEDMKFEQRTLLSDLRRVTDVQAADFDADGDLDLTVAVFGFDHGEVLWLENDGKQVFRERQLLASPGAIHTPVADFDQDGDLDFATVMTQEEEEIWGFENQSKQPSASETQGESPAKEQAPMKGKDSQFKSHLLSFSFNFDLGGAGLVADDLDQDGDVDLLLPAGDNLDLLQHYPQPFHGCYWLENLGDWKFKRHRIAEFGGTYAAAVSDLDGDGDRDVVLVSVFNDWMDPEAASLVWLENDGKQEFTTWEIAKSPSHLVTVACGDLDGDGRDDIVAGGMHLKEPFDRLGRITIWLSSERQP